MDYSWILKANFCAGIWEFLLPSDICNLCKALCMRIPHQRIKKNGKKYYLVNSILHGPCIEKASGTIATCRYYNGKLQGLVKIEMWDYTRNTNIVIAKEYYKNGKLNGLQKNFHHNGKLKELWNARDGQMIGVYQTFDQDGNEINAVIHLDNKIISYSSQDYYNKIILHKDQMDKIMFKYRDNELRFIYTMRNDDLYGEYKMFIHGQLYEKIEYENNVKEGLQCTYINNFLHEIKMNKNDAVQRLGLHFGVSPFIFDTQLKKEVLITYRHLHNSGIIRPKKVGDDPEMIIVGNMFLNVEKIDFTSDIPTFLKMVEKNTSLFSKLMMAIF